MVSSVDLTQSPPLLSIDGQTYTMSQIKSDRTPATPADDWLLHGPNH